MTTAAGVGLGAAEREALAEAIENDLYTLLALNETGVPSAHWFGWYLTHKSHGHVLAAVERILADREAGLRERIQAVVDKWEAQYTEDDESGASVNPFYMIEELKELLGSELTSTADRAVLDES